MNTMTGWPYDSGGGGHYDWDTAKNRGLPAPFDVGCMRAVMTSHLLSNWMGDDGFIRRVDVQFRKPNFWGTTRSIKLSPKIKVMTNINSKYLKTKLFALSKAMVLCSRGQRPERIRNRARLLVYVSSCLRIFRSNLESADRGRYASRVMSPS